RVLFRSGAGANSTAHAVELARNAEKAGAQAILSVAPYYNKPSQEGFYQHFRHVAEAVSIPIIVYNVPGRTSSNVSAETILRLARDCDNVLAVKEASANFEQIMTLIDERPKHFSVMTGEDGLMLPFMALGGDGVISVAANQVPKAVKALIEAAKTGNLDEARKLNNKYRKLFRLNFIESNPVPVKYAMSLMGMIKEVYRLPLVPMSDDNKTALKLELEKLELV
ncbi:MAG TPA: 4-hydroxy-tetrahydrodipicolinate synthase, partial [Chlorobaculum parvum]|nr:4-hydroxy-tetrahydrodipicolinate synthase [Chlorobaculum parvum]